MFKVIRKLSHLEHLGNCIPRLRRSLKLDLNFSDHFKNIPRTTSTLECSSTATVLGPLLVINNFLVHNLHLIFHPFVLHRNARPSLIKRNVWFIHDGGLRMLPTLSSESLITVDFLHNLVLIILVFQVRNPLLFPHLPRVPARRVLRIILVLGRKRVQKFPRRRPRRRRRRRRWLRRRRRSTRRSHRRRRHRHTPIRRRRGITIVPANPTTAVIRIPVIRIRIRIRIRVTTHITKRVIRRGRRRFTHMMYGLGTHGSLLKDHRRGSFVLHIIHMQKPTSITIPSSLIRLHIINMTPWTVQRRGVIRVMQRTRIVGVGIGMELKMGVRIGMGMKMMVMWRLGTFESTNIGIAFSVRREIELGRRRRPRSIRITQFELNKVTQRVPNTLEGVNVSHVSFGEGIALVNRLVQKGAPLSAERHRREIVDLGAGAAHHSINSLFQANNQYY
ncbi:hypothetical protein TorRG33x02_238190 [Trema orientale]|uniref:Uncharacterized protein n=1 Tax=Trema orientale TaxID=63057 RepID=A0A2P5DYX3_TREOI|nr:hypothetical protein TorRG33x02_238190 [Trema orientale]